MANTLMTTRPYIVSSNGTSLFLKSLPFFFRPKRSFVSQTDVLLNNSSSNALSFWSCKINRQFGGVAGSNRIASKLESAFEGKRSFTIKATHVNDAGSIDSPMMQSMEKKIKEHLNAESVIVRDASGDGRHVCIDVVASAFEGQSTVNRQRMVYKAIWEELQNTVHAVDQMTTKTPSEAGQK